MRAHVKTKKNTKQVQQSHNYQIYSIISCNLTCNFGLRGDKPGCNRGLQKKEGLQQ